MAKQENWFKHDIDSGQKPEMRLYVQQLGAAGYGFFWAVVEEMYRRDTWEISKEVALKVGRTLQLDLARASHYLATAIKEELWVEKGDSVISLKVKKVIAGRKRAEAERSDRARKNGRLGGLAKASNRYQKLANLPRLDKSRLDKSRLERECYALPPDERSAMVLNHYHGNETLFQQRYGEMVDYMMANAMPPKPDMAAYHRSWIQKHLQYYGRPATMADPAPKLSEDDIEALREEHL